MALRFMMEAPRNAITLRWWNLRRVPGRTALADLPFMLQIGTLLRTLPSAA